jgi:hypothetical protein
MDLDLTDDEKAALIRELDGIIREDRYPLSPRIMTLKAILGKLRPEPVHPPLPPLKYYEPPKGRDAETTARLASGGKNRQDFRGKQKWATSI